MGELYDTLIIGAGPGGATAAYFLAEAGQRVLLLERGVPPRYKACGGGLSALMLESIFPFSFESVIESQVTTITWDYKNRSVEVPAPVQAVRTVMRAEFDAHLLRQTRAEVRTGQTVRKVTELADRVRVETVSGQVFEGRYLIGADGANSMVARAVGLRRGKAMAAALEAEVPITPETNRRFGHTLLFILGDVRTGYAWVFPKAGYLSVGIMALRPRPGELQARLAEVVARYGLSLEGVPVKGHPIPLYLRREPIMTARTLLVGDAAGLADPFSGEGIRLAIKSGQLAAQALLSAEAARYPDLVWGAIGRSQWLAIWLARVFYRFPSFMFRVGVSNPLLTPPLMEILAGRMGYGRVILIAAATLPVYALTEIAARLAGAFGRPKASERLRGLLVQRMS
jgi:geranylgeranyl reductase family protein